MGYGSYEFLKQSSGLINIYSLKNPSHPEFSISTEAGVMCLHFHPEYSNLLAVGCYDGAVLVYDIHAKTSAPIYQATVQTGKHNDPVWSIFWQVGRASPRVALGRQRRDCCFDGPHVPQLHGDESVQEALVTRSIQAER